MPDGSRDHGAARASNPLAPLGRRVRESVESVGYLGALLAEAVFWTLFGKRFNQTVRLSAVFRQMTTEGVQAIPIVAGLSFTVGIMLAIQMLATLSQFGAESRIILAIALSVTREFGPLITGIVVAGRSASALAARIGSMVVSQEVDALRVMGVEPARYLVAPPLLALLIMTPALTVIADVAAVLGGAVYSVPILDLTFRAYLAASVDALAVGDIGQSMGKAAIFGVIVALIGVASGFRVRGGAEGVGRATTQAVVVSISLIIVADMIVTYFVHR